MIEPRPSLSDDLTVCMTALATDSKRFEQAAEGWHARVVLRRAVAGADRVVERSTRRAMTEDARFASGL